MCVLYRRSNLFETRQTGKVVQHCGNILNPLPDLLRGAVKKITFSQKSGQNQLGMKKYVFFAFSHFNNFFVTHSHIPAILNFLDLILLELSHSQSPQHSKTYLKILETKTETHIILWQS